MKFTFHTSLFVTLVFLSCSKLQADLVFTVTESEGMVNVEANGSLDLAATLEFFGVESGLAQANLTPRVGQLGVGSVDFVFADAYRISEVAASPLTSFGNGGFVTAAGGSGDTVSLDGSFAGFVIVELPVGYVSGELLSGSANFTGDFESLGVDVGVFTSTITNATGSVSDTITVNVIGVPEPSSLTIVGIGAAVLISRRRRRQIGT